MDSHRISADAGNDITLFTSAMLYSFKPRGGGGQYSVGSVLSAKSDTVVQFLPKGGCCCKAGDTQCQGESWQMLVREIHWGSQMGHWESKPIEGQTNDIRIRKSLDWIELEVGRMLRRRATNDCPVLTQLWLFTYGHCWKDADLEQSAWFYMPLGIPALAHVLSCCTLALCFWSSVDYLFRAAILMRKGRSCLFLHPMPGGRLAMLRGATLPPPLLTLVILKERRTG